MKDVIKEIFIMLILCVAIILILAVVFYDYNPINKVVPTTLTYKMPDDLSEVKEEIETTLISSEEKVIKTYEITEDELKLLEKVNYEPGKANPFELYKDDTENTENTDKNTNTNTNSNNNSTTNKGNTTNTNSTGHFFDDGTKK